VKSHARRLPVVFLAADALDPGAVGRTFDTLIDCGCFHTLTDEDRPRYAASMRVLSAPESGMHIMCFSEGEPAGWGPRRVTQAELQATFADDWQTDSVVAVQFETRLGQGGAQAWLASFRRSAK